MATAQAGHVPEDRPVAVGTMPALPGPPQADDSPACRPSGVASRLWRLIVLGRPVLAGLVAVAVTGCATSPEKANRQAYDAYWQCAVHAVRPYMADQRLSARDAALAAQGRCNTPYARFHRTQIGVVRSKVDRDSADLASQLGGRQARIMYGKVTQALMKYVRDARGRS